MNINKKRALKKQIDEAKASIAKLREQNSPAPKTLGLAYLIESDLEKPELILAIRSITNELQTMAEKVAKIEAQEIMPINDAMKSAFGPEAAERFYRACTESIRSLVDAIQTSKNAVSDEIMRLQGGAVNDIANADADHPEAGLDDAGLDGADPLAGNDMGGGEDMGEEDPLADAGDIAPIPTDGADMGAEAGPELGDDMGDDDMTNAAGRPRKESFISDRKILETFAKQVRGGAKPTAAARVVAERYAIDVSDVRAIVKEAASKKAK